LLKAHSKKIQRRKRIETKKDLLDRTGGVVGWVTLFKSLERKRSGRQRGGNSI